MTSLGSLYNSEIDSLPPELQTAAGVLYAAVRSVSIFQSNDLSQQKNKLDQNQHTPCHHFVSNDGKKAQLQILGPEATFTSLVDQAEEQISFGVNALLVELYDDIAFRLSRARDRILSDPTGYVQGLMNFKRRALLRNQIAKLIQATTGTGTDSNNNGLPMSPENSIQERSIKESELLTFSSLSASDLYRADQLLTFDKMLDEVAKPLPNFTGTIRRLDGEDGVLKRRYFRRISAMLLPQILAAESLREPHMLRRYYPLTDELLVALYWPSPDRRMGKSTWRPVISEATWKSVSNLKHKRMLIAGLPSTTAVVVESGSGNGSMTHSATPTPRIDPSAGTNSKSLKLSTFLNWCQRKITITPAGNAVVLVQQSTKTQDAWVSVYVNGCVLGLRYGFLVGGPEVQKSGSDPTTTLTGRKAVEAASVNAAAAAAAAPVAAPVPAAAAAAAGKGGKGGKAKEAPPKKGGGKDAKTKGAAAAAAKEEPIPAAAALVAASVADGKHDSPSRRSSKADGGAATPLEDFSVFPTADQNLNIQGGCFFCHTDDDVRIVAFVGPSPSTSTSPSASPPSRKPDGFGTVGVLMIHPSGVGTTLCSNGTVKFEALAPGALRGVSTNDPLQKLVETSRYVCAGASVVRNFATGPFSKDILSTDGTRTLVVNRRGGSLGGGGGGGVSVGNDATAGRLPRGFYADLINGAPSDWKYVRFGVDGSVVFHLCDVGTVPEDEGELHSNPALSNILTESVDAETQAVIYSYADGRVISHHEDGMVEVVFPDGTRVVTHSSQAVAVITKDSLPPVEVDLEINGISRDHARGMKVPIAKGGDRVRVRVALADGSAGMIKYDTRITSSTNGSIKIVRRDRSVVLIKDSGVVTYFPKESWDDQAAAEFSADCADSSPTQGEDPQGAMAAMRRRGSLPQLNPSVTFAETKGSSDGNSSPGGGGGSPLHKGGGGGGGGTSMNQYSPHNNNKAELKSSSLTSTSSSPERQGHSHYDGNNNKNDASIVYHHHHNGNERQSILSSNKMSHLNVIGGSSSSGKDDETKKANRVGGEAKANSIASSSLKNGKQQQPPHSKMQYTKFTANILAYTCLIEDHEHNIFDIDLKNPLNPKASLSGEVEGLKPTAVTDTPMEPRLFVLNRSAEAVEVVSIQEINQLEHLVSTCPDAYKIVSDVAVQPSDLSAGKQFSYFIRRRMGVVGDSFTFDEVFSQRVWHTRATPAAASLIIHGNSTNVPGNSKQTRVKKNKQQLALQPSHSRQRPRTLHAFTAVEHAPLSQEGYQQLTGDFQLWSEFRDARAKAIDRFAVADPRAQAELEEEDGIKRRLKAAYKQAKLNAALRKEKEKMEAQVAVEQEAAAKGQMLPQLSTAMKATGTLVEEDEEEDDDLMADFSDDEEEVKLEPEEIEIRAAFEDFAFLTDQQKVLKDEMSTGSGQTGRRHSNNSTAAHSVISILLQSRRGSAGNHSHAGGTDALAEPVGVLPYSSLRDALIQVLNCNVSQDLIRDTLENTGYRISPALKISLTEFRNIYNRIKESIATRRDAGGGAWGGGGGGIRTILTSSSGDDEELLRPIAEESSLASISTQGLVLGLGAAQGQGQGLVSDSSLNKHSSSSLSPTRTRGGGGGGGDGSKSSATTTTTRTSAFWHSKRGQNSAVVVPSSPPPLDYRPLDWSIREDDRSELRSRSRSKSRSRSRSPTATEDRPQLSPSSFTFSRGGGDGDEGRGGGGGEGGGGAAFPVGSALHAARKKKAIV